MGWGRGGGGGGREAGRAEAESEEGVDVGGREEMEMGLQGGGCSSFFREQSGRHTHKLIGKRECLILPCFFLLDVAATIIIKKISSTPGWVQDGVSSRLDQD